MLYQGPSELEGHMQKVEAESCSWLRVGLVRLAREQLALWTVLGLLVDVLVVGVEVLVIVCL